MTYNNVQFGQEINGKTYTFTDNLPNVTTMTVRRSKRVIIIIQRDFCPAVEH